jgi:hypothetical protein
MTREWRCCAPTDPRNKRKIGRIFTQVRSRSVGHVRLLGSASLQKRHRLDTVTRTLSSLRVGRGARGLWNAFLLAAIVAAVAVDAETRCAATHGIPEVSLRPYGTCSRSFSLPTNRV